MLTERQNQLLKIIINQYIETAEPVGSEWLADNFHFEDKDEKLSPATIRNEMTILLEYLCTEISTNNYKSINKYYLCQLICIK